MIPLPTPIERCSFASTARVSRALGWLAALSLSASIALPAQAEGSLANELFQQGKALMEQGSISEGCQKLAESLALQHRGGTLLNLAVCRNKEGRYATALRLYQEALEVAMKDGRGDREQLARASLEEIRPKLSWLAVKLAPGAEPAGLRVRRDGVDVPRSAWGAPEAVDAGKHTIAATAPGRKPFNVVVIVGGPGDKRVVEIPLLEEIAPAPPRAARPPAALAGTDVGARAWKRPLGTAVLGLGVVTVLTGGIFGMRAIADSNQSKGLCPDRRCPTDEGYMMNQRARTAAVVADIAVPAGLAASGVGIFLLLTSRAPISRAATFQRLLPEVGPNLAGLSLQGAW